MMTTRSLLSRATAAVSQDLEMFEIRRAGFLALTRLLPAFSLNRLRVMLLRASGWRIERTSTVFGTPRVFGVPPTPGRMVVGHHVRINIGLSLELSQPVTIGDGASIGPNVTILTATHRLAGSAARAGDMSYGAVTIGPGVWLGAGTIVLAGVTVGAGAVVGAGSVVNKDVPPNALVMGVPAQTQVTRLPG